MKYLLIACISIFYAAGAVSQTKFSFKTDGKATVSSAKGRPVGFAKEVNKPPVSNFTLSDLQKKELKKEIATKFEKSIDNLEDEKLNLASAYDAIWGKGEIAKIIAEYRAFLSYLNDTTGPASSHDNTVSYAYLPKPSVFEARVFNAPVYTEKEDSSGKKYNARQLIFTNPYHRFILEYLQETMNETGSKINEEKMSLEYKKAWREVEEKYNAAVNEITKIKDTLGKCVVPICGEDYRNVANELDAFLKQKTNRIIKLLQKPFYKKWLWYNDGFLVMNPLGVTTSDKRYPASEKITLQPASEKELVPAGPVEDKMIDTLLSTMKLKNEVLTAKKNDADRYYYDADSAYRCLNKSNLPVAKDDRKGLSIVVYNVSAKDKLSINFILNESSGLGKISQEIINAGTSGSLSTILGSSADWVASWKKVSSEINGVPKKPFAATPNIGADDVKIALYGINISANKLKSKNLTYSTFKFNQQQSEFTDNEKNTKSVDTDSDFWNEFLKSTNGDLFATINKRNYAATKKSDVDKIVFVNAYLIKEDSKVCNTCIGLTEQCIIDSFLIRDKCYALTYENQNAFNSGVESLLERFKCFTVLIDSCRNKFKNLLVEISDNYLPQLKAYAGILQRSLPPVFTRKNEKLSSDTAEFRTEIFEKSKAELPKDAKDITYQVISSIPGKAIDGKSVSNNVVIEHSYRYAKRTRIDFSAGLACSLGDYYIKSNESGTPAVSEGDKFRPIAGMHVYPFSGGILRVDDRIKPQLSRLSIFVGVGLTKTLENFYPGISYDIIPGIRILGGYHIFKDTRYTIVNNQVVDQASSYKGSGIFVSLNLEPRAFGSIIGGLLKL
ncbi:MAG: hypothetical protein IPL84_04450 [Chitinophagaceae bacterium]|nr:hypothetical protein [Chitinophagaceae bacterium]